MIEIGVLIFLCSRMRNLLYERGWDRTFWMQVLVIAVWFGAEFTGALIYGVVLAIREGESALENVGFMVYPAALIGGILGQLLLFWLVKSRTGQSDEPSEVEALATEWSESTEAIAPRHSRLGVASFAMACLAGVSMFVLFALAIYMESTQPGVMDEESSSAILVGLFGMGLLLLSLVALGIGVGGLFQKQKRKLFAVLGVVISGLTVAGVSLLVILP